MLKRFWLLNYFLCLLFAEKASGCMETPVRNKPENIHEISLLEAQPLEILRNMVLAFFELNKNEHCIHSAQRVYNQTAGWRESNCYFNQTIEQLIVTYCFCELAKLSSEEKFQILKNCNPKNQLGIILILLSFTIKPSEIFESKEYRTLKKCFRNKIISYNVKGYFEFDFQSEKGDEILKMITILENFIKQSNYPDLVESHYKKKLGINTFNVIESAIRYIRKDLLKELVRSNYKETKRIDFDPEFLSILAYFYYKPNPVFLKCHLKSWIKRHSSKALFDYNRSCSPLDWAIILDEETAISLIYEIHPNLYGSDSQNPIDQKRAYSHILSNLNFAALFAQPLYYN